MALVISSRIILRTRLCSSTAPRMVSRLFSDDEVTRSAAAAANKTPSTTVFSRILNKELSADIIYEDDKVSIV